MKCFKIPRQRQVRPNMMKLCNYQFYLLPKYLFSSVGNTHKIFFWLFISKNFASVNFNKIVISHYQQIVHKSHVNFMNSDCIVK